MELKNIHSRKNFIKTNEIFGGTQGGVGEKDGFANNAKLKDTLLGKLLNGLFKGISWLWRKSKENFVINRLIAQLVNELMRGIILFCFENNISLTEGSISGEQSNIKGNELDDKNQEDEEDEEEESEKPKKLTREELNKKIEEFTDYCNQSNANISNITSMIHKLNKELSTLTKGTDIDYKKGEIEKAKNNLNVQKDELKQQTEKLNHYKELLRNMGGDVASQQQKTQETKLDFNEIEEACKKKNKFANFPKVKEELKNITSLPEDYSGFIDIKNKCFTFLKKYVPEYNNNNMDDSEKENVERVYVQYKLIYDLDKLKKDETANESMQLNEESLVRNTTSNLTHSAGTVKVKPDEPRAGKVSIGKSIAMKAGASANVGNILTKRDRDKHKDKEEQFSIDIHDVNLAEIEKTVQELEKTNKEVKTNVSSFVNPYNLKTIQLSAEQLMTPRKTDNGTDNNDDLRLRWNKELTKTFASFTFIMDVDKLSSIMKNESSTLNNSKLQKNVDNLTSNIKNQSDDAETSSKLPLVEGYGNYSKMSEGGWFYYSFDHKSRLFKTAISPVQDTFNKFGLVNVTSWINTVDEEHNKITEDTNLNIFYSKNSDSPKQGNIDKINIYLLFKYKQIFPESNRLVPAKVLVLNEYLYNTGDSYIFLKKNGVSQDVKITQNVVDNFVKTDYIFDIKTVNCKKFSDDIKNLKPALNMITSDDIKNTDFRRGKNPKFLTDDVIELLKSLSDKI